jgi:hypothetical protein
MGYAAFTSSSEIAKQIRLVQTVHVKNFKGASMRKATLGCLAVATILAACSKLG